MHEVTAEAKDIEDRKAVSPHSPVVSRRCSLLFREIMRAAFGGGRPAAPTSATLYNLVDLTVEETISNNTRRSSSSLAKPSSSNPRIKASSPALAPSRVGDCVKGKNGTPDMLAAYPIVVKLDNTWTEIWYAQPLQRH